VTALLACVLAAAAPPTPTFGVGVEGVYVDVFVTEGNRPVTGLAAADFELRDDGTRRPVELVAVDSLPLTTFLVLDMSDSVAGEKLAQLQKAAKALLGGLRPADEAALVTFDHEIRLPVPPTPDHDALTRAVDGARPRGATALLDALYAGTMLASGRGRSLLVLFSDGEDNMSWLEAAQVRRVLEEANVLVQAVGVLPAEEPAAHAFGSRPPPPETPHARVLRRLAEVTGGRFWPAGSPGDLASAFLAVLEAMKTRYVLRFEPERGRREGRHELEVKLVRRGGRVHCRKAYFVGPASP
jgi:VWFA-related protein